MDLMIEHASAALLAASRYPRLARDQWLAPEALARLQMRRLRATLRHAYDACPFHHERFRDAGITPADIRTPADLALLPVMTREDLRAPTALLARGHNPARLHRSTTSGSTGRRTTTCFDEAAWLTGKHLIKLRARRACGVGMGDRVALFQEADGDRPDRRLLGRARTFSIHVPVDAVLPAVLRFAPSVLYGFPGHLLRLAQAAAGRLRPRLVFTSGELLDRRTRRDIEALLGATVLDVYGSTETKEVAWECPHRTGYHVNADWLVVETAAFPGAPAAAPGRILVTSLYNRAMPLLRYEVGDTGRLVDGGCLCGRGLPLMRPASGRSVDYFRLPDGTTITPYDMTCAIEHVPGLRRFQIVQRALDRIEVRILPGPDFGAAGPPAVRAALRPVLHGLEAEVRLVDDFAPEPSGKFRVVRSELATAPADR